MKINTIQVIDSSELFEKICEHFKIDSSNFAGEFSDVCTSVSYGDASHTLISRVAFIDIINDMEYFSSSTVEEFETILSWIPQNVMIDLEN